MPVNYSSIKVSWLTAFCAKLCLCFCLAFFAMACDDDNSSDNNTNNGGNDLGCEPVMSYTLSPNGANQQSVSDDDAGGTLSTTVLSFTSSGGASNHVLTLTVNSGVNELELNKRYEIGNILEMPTSDFAANARSIDGSATQYFSISGGITLTSNTVIDDNPVIKIRCIEGTFDCVLGAIGAPENTRTITGGTFRARVSGS